MNRFNKWLALTAFVAISAFYSAQAVIYVDKDATGANSGASWANAYQELWYALGRTTVSETYWVAAGTYTNQTINTAMTNQSGDVLLGGFAGTETAASQRDWVANPTIITGDHDGDNDTDRGGTASLMNSSNVLPLTYIEIDGFTFSYGYRSGYGGAILKPHLGPALNLRNNIFHHNVSRYGGAIGSASDNGAVSRIENCLFYTNLCTHGAFGGAMYNRRGVAPIWHIGNSTFVDNYAYNVGVLQTNTHHMSTFVAGGYVISNSIIYNITDSSADRAQAFREDGTQPVITYSDVSTRNGAIFPAGTGNITPAAPAFVNLAAGNFRMNAGSAGLDVGLNTGAPAKDLDGVARPQNVTVDMGAYERLSLSQYNITLNGDPVGGDPFSVSIVAGGTYPVTTPHGPSLYDGGSVTLTATTPKTISAGISRYDLKRWQDTSGGIFTANPLAITLGVATNFTLYYFTEYKVNQSTNPLTGAGTIALSETDGWATNGATITYTATPGPGWTFNHWEDSTGSQLGSANPLDRVVSVQTNITGFFSCSGSSITVQTSPSGLGIWVEGANAVAPQTYCYVAASSKAFSVTNPYTINATAEYRFTNWWDTTGLTSAGSTNFAYTVPGVDATAIAYFDTYYKLTGIAGANGLITTNVVTVDNFHVSGTALTLTAAPTTTGYVFDNWSGDISGTVNPTNIVMNAAKSITANFKRIYYVDDSAVGADNGLGWTDAYNDLNQALTAAPAGSEFWVAAGTYTNANTSTALTLDDVDAIYGGFAGTETQRGQRNWVSNPTTITGDHNNDSVSDMAGTAPLMNSVANNAAYCVVDGFTFRYGKFTAGAGYGGAISKGNPGASFRIKHCVFRDNTAIGGGAIGIASNGSGEGTTNSVENCLFYDNTATSAANGGALYFRRGDFMRVMNSTFMNNSSGGTIDDIYRNASAAVTVQNSVLWSSTDPITAGTVTFVTYSDVRQSGPVFTGTGNINSDPLFVNSASDDYRLYFGSPALDTASASGTGIVTDDYTGAVRPQDDDGDTIAEYDMGAYEGHVTTTTSSTSTSSSSSTTTSSSSTTSSSTTTSSTSTTASGTLPATSVIRFL